MVDIYYPVGTKVEMPTDTANFKLGQRAEGQDNSEWIYVQADSGGVTGEGYVVLLDENYAADMIDTTNSASAFGQRVGVAKTAVSADQFFWVQVRGRAKIRGAAEAAANATLNTTGTAGELNDDGTAGAEAIDGLILTTAVGATAGVAEGILNDPTVGATL